MFNRIPSIKKQNQKKGNLESNFQKNTLVSQKAIYLDREFTAEVIALIHKSCY